MSRTGKKPDRSSKVDAEAVMSAICPDATLRQEVLRCLLETIEFVARSAPNAWAVTLFDWGFRLNVGPVEALTCGVLAEEQILGEGGLLEIRLLTQGELPIEVSSAQQMQQTRVQVWSTQYTSIPSPQQAVCLAVDQATQLASWREQLRPSHQRYLAEALRTSTGRIRTGTTFRRTHSQGLVDYALMFCDAVLESVEEDGDATELAVAEFFEGRPIAIQTTRYERDVNARRACIAWHGCVCAACGFSFGATYGSIADHYIQVHHLNPLAAHGGGVATNPVLDMRPLCANCHAVAHFRSPPFTVEELRSFINKEHKS